ncbi:DrmB family protein [Nocardia sp. NPDC050406]|uniref:DrmB family protein n=1 Tax=Nocardia sp. NPDC050406 TaxID=3364318 RepID=UPI0037A50183
MSPVPARGRKRRPALPETRGYPKIGSVRRAQLITTYGVGALVAFENGSYIVCGLDDWTLHDTRTIEEPRLAGILGVDNFRLPPAPAKEAGDGIKVRRFPRWYSCAKCLRLAPFSEFNSPKGTIRCAECDEELAPSRFIAACADGHVTDFPYRAWLHRVPDEVSGSCNRELSIRTQGTTASLRSIIISCECGRSASMEGSFRRNALSSLKIRCYGDQPWLDVAGGVPCSEPLRTLQRGSSAGWYPMVRSAISIPPWSDGLYRIIGPYLSRLRGLSDAEIAGYLKVEKCLEGTDFTPADAIQIVREAEGGGEGGPPDWPGLLKQEYLMLGSRTSEDNREQQFVCEPPTTDSTPVRQLGISKTMLVHRLREVRALQSFTRVVGPSEQDDKKRMAPLSRSKVSWLPAIEVIGEGVFLDLSGSRLIEWESSRAVVDRVTALRNNHIVDLVERTGGLVTESFVTPRYVLLHTLAHILVNEWSLDAGYPAAALRERLYVADDMAGILIYAAATDSAGSLGGVVAQGEPDRFVSTLKAALERAKWCSSDPLCMESGTVASGTLNLAACHCCVMLPETSCEANNHFLDRALLSGTPGNVDIGYFAGITG